VFPRVPRLSRTLRIQLNNITLKVPHRRQLEARLKDIFGRPGAAPTEAHEVYRYSILSRQLRVGIHNSLTLTLSKREPEGMRIVRLGEEGAGEEDLLVSDDQGLSWPAPHNL